MYVASRFRKRARIEGPVSIEIVFLLKKPKSVPKKRKYPNVRPDLDNYAKGVLDALNGLCWRDDSSVISLNLHKRYATDKPGIFIHFEEMRTETDYVPDHFQVADSRP